MADPTHTIHVTGVSDYGPEFELLCDDTAACEERSKGGCRVQSWWIEYGIDLVHGDIWGSPPWQVTCTWPLGDDGPELRGVGPAETTGGEG